MKRQWRYVILGVCAALLILAGVYMLWYRSQNTSENAADTHTQESVDTYILLSGESCTIQGAGAEADGGKVLISRPGIYALSGSWEEGQIYVDAGDDGTVTLILDGAELTNTTEPVIYIEQAKETDLELAADSENLLQSGLADQGTSQPEQEETEETGGALFSRDDLTISGDGSLRVYGYLHDGIHGNDSLTILGGTITITAANKGIRSNDSLVIGGGSVEILDSYEGLESNQIYIDGGDVSITARDDGINAYGGQVQAGKGSGGKKTETMPALTIAGGSVYVNAQGDGLDSNGDLTISGGTLVVDGPESSMNGALDYGRENGGSCQVNGGTALAVGSTYMAETFGSSSTQASFELVLDTTEEGAQIRILDEEGEELFSHTAAKSFSDLVFSCPELEEDGIYTVCIGDRSIQVTMTSKTTRATVREESRPREENGPGRRW